MNSALHLIKTRGATNLTLSRMVVIILNLKTKQPFFSSLKSLSDQEIILTSNSDYHSILEVASFQNRASHSTRTTGLLVSPQC